MTGRTSTLLALPCCLAGLLSSQASCCVFFRPVQLIAFSLLDNSYLAGSITLYPHHISAKMPIIGVNKPVVTGIGFTLFLIILFAIQRPGFASLAAQNDAILGPRSTIHHNQTKIEPTIDLTKVLPRTKKVAGVH